MFLDTGSLTRLGLRGLTVSLALELEAHHHVQLFNVAFGVQNSGLQVARQAPFLLSYLPRLE